MHTAWKGSISFGLINIPVKMGAATSKESVSFRMLHKGCNAPIQQKRVCSKCGKEVAFDDIVKGYEYEPDKFVIISDEELDNLPIKSAKHIDIVDFIDIGEVDPVYYDKTYYLWPEKGGEKPYLILREAMRSSSRAAVAKVSMRQKEHLCIVRLIGDALAIETMFFPDEVRSYDELGLDKLQVDVRPQEMEMAKQLVENLTAKFDPSKYQDDYREALLKIIRAKIENEDIVLAESPAAAAPNVIDLMERLRQSVEATKKPGEPEPAKKRAPRKKKAAEG